MARYPPALQSRYIPASSWKLWQVSDYHLHLALSVNSITSPEDLSVLYPNWIRTYRHMRVPELVVATYSPHAAYHAGHLYSQCFHFQYLKHFMSDNQDYLHQILVVSPLIAFSGGTVCCSGIQYGGRLKMRMIWLLLKYC